jgi:hypothetical protein
MEINHLNSFFLYIKGVVNVDINTGDGEVCCSLVGIVLSKTCGNGK